ncbi:MAG TPA: DUF4252 domain-containing protein [Verrucomicrobiae bacterium]|nr:DUF4252 domain-containing protein [Verrucomicrobiae bacterium]
MKRHAFLAACAIVLPLAAQQFQFHLDHLAAKASDSVDVSLNGSTLQFAAKFLDGSDPEEAKVKKLLSSIDGIYVRSFEFKTAGVWSQADLDNVRNQLKAPEWSRIVEVKSAEDGETAEVYVRTVDKKISGVAVLYAEPKELTVANIVGPVDLDSLAELSGHFGLPKLKSEKSTRHM